MICIFTIYYIPLSSIFLCRLHSFQALTMQMIQAILCLVILMLLTEYQKMKVMGILQVIQLILVRNLESRYMLHTVILIYSHIFEDSEEYNLISIAKSSRLFLQICLCSFFFPITTVPLNSRKTRC